MIFQVRRDGDHSGSCGFFEPGNAMDEVLAGMIAGETVTVTPERKVDESPPGSTGISEQDNG